ncbi:MAG: TRAP transporter large permease subunit [Alphaproteobacteria bacterium]|nr:TRAP transporter large permease subunit [Alphaproteobacteria bacterium]
MEIFFLIMLIVLMAGTLASGFPVAFSLPGSAIITVCVAALAGYFIEGNPDAYFAQGGASNWLSAGVTNFRGVYWDVNRDTLIAIPLFVFMGIMLQRSKIAEDLLITMAQLFGPVRGGLGISVVFVGALLAATTGILGATVVAMGMISLPAMMRNNYHNWLSTGTIAASGTLGQIIPPSIVLIILADQLSNAVDQAGALRTAAYKAATGEFSMPSEFSVTSTSAGDMFMGAMVPGLVLVAVYMLFILIVAFIKRDVAPPVPFSGSYDRKFAVNVLVALLPPLALIFVVLGSIIAGIATVNQAGAVGAVGATVMAGYRLYEGHRRAFWPAALTCAAVIVIMVLTSLYTVNVKAIESVQDEIVMGFAILAVIAFLAGVIWSGSRTMRVGNTMQGVLMETAKTTSLVFIILLGAAMLTAAFRGFGGEEMVREFLTGLPGGFWTQFIIVMAVIFFLGFFLDFIEIAVVVVPIVTPILLADPSANVSAVWLGVMIGLNMQTSFLTPPFGFALFYLRGVAPPAVKTIQMYKGVVPFISLQLLALVIVGLNPSLVNYLPTRVSLTSETAPPPANPRLQTCIQEYVWEEFQSRGDAIKMAIADAQKWDLSTLPADLQTNVQKGLELATGSFDALQTARAASDAKDAAAVAYKPLLDQVRDIQDDMADHKRELDDKKQTLGRLKRNGDDPKLEERLAARIAVLEEESKALKASIPSDWADTRKVFTKYLSEEKRAYGQYRRTVDGAYEPIKELLETLKGAEDLAKIRQDVADLESVIQNASHAELDSQFKTVESEIGTVTGAGDIRNALSDARRAITSSNTPDKEAALQSQAKALALVDSEIAWRTKASDALLTQVQTYERAIHDTIGVRQLDRLPHNVALYVTSCTAGHTDISLYF